MVLSGWSKLEEGGGNFKAEWLGVSVLESELVGRRAGGLDGPGLGGHKKGGGLIAAGLMRARTGRGSALVSIRRVGKAVAELLVAVLPRECLGATTSKRDGREARGGHAATGGSNRSLK